MSGSPSDIEALLAASPPPPDLPDQLAALVIRRPADRSLLRRCRDALAAAGMDLAAWDEALHARAGGLLPLVLTDLATDQGEAAPRRRFAATITAAADAFAPVARTFDALLDGTEAEAGDAAAVADDRLGLVEAWFRFARPVPEMLPLRGDDPAHEAALQAAGIALGPMRGFLKAFLQPSPAWAEEIAAARLPSPEGRARVQAAEAACGWMDRVLETGRLTVADPLTGVQVSAVDSLVAFGRGLYLFRGQEPFFLATGGPWNAPLGFHLPRRGLTLAIGNAAGRLMAGETLANLLGAWLRRRAAPEGEAPRHAAPVLHVPPTENLAHQMWNYHSAIERFIRLGQVPRLGAVQFAGTEFFGPLGELFPELPPAILERPRRHAVADPLPGSPVPVLRAGGFFIPRRLSERIIAAMRARPRGRPTAVEPADIPGLGDGPVIWLGLRLRGRSWVGQEEGMGVIIRRLAARWPRALFLLDGFSYPVGADGISHRWADAIAALEAMAARIRARAPEPERVVSMVGNTLRESVLWATRTDAYLAPLGTTQHKVASFSDAPGLVYAPPFFTAEVVLASPGFAAAEISALPELIHGTPVDTGRGELGPPRAMTPGTANLDLDAEVLAARLAALVAARWGG